MPPAPPARARALALLAAVALAAAVAPSPARAAGDRGPTRLAGDLGVRAFIGFTGDMGLSPAMWNRAISGSKLLVGADLLRGPDTGLVWAFGLHLGVGGGAFVLQPVVEAHYRFHLPLPVVPWVGAGASLKVGFGSYLATNLAVTVRLDAGLEYLVTSHVAVGMELVLPDLGPVLVNDLGYLIGSVEFFVGPQIRF